MSNLTIATDPNQYDSKNHSWEHHTKTNPRNIFFGEHLNRYFPLWKDKSILDVGCGTGWLLNEANKFQIKKALGIEPSITNVELLKQNYPELSVVQTTIEEFKSAGERFDIILSIMSLPHIKNLKLAFTKSAELLNTNGELLIVVPDFVYFRTERKSYKIEIEDLNKNEYIAKITRPSGTLIDLVRSNNQYLKAANNAGLKLIEHSPLTPTDNYLMLNPNYTQDLLTPIAQLFRFKK